MKKIFILFGICFLPISIFFMKQQTAFAGYPEGGCKPSDAIDRNDGCEKVCDVLRTGDDSKELELIDASYCGTCPGKPDKNNQVLISFYQMFIGCCLSHTPKTPCDYTAKYCDYTYDWQTGKCSKVVKTKSITDNNGYCTLWYLNPIYSIDNYPLMKDSGSLQSKIGTGRYFNIWEPFITSNSNSNLIRSIELDSDNYNQTLEAYLMANGLKLCTKDSDCARCKDTDPECLTCESGKTKPYWKCSDNTCNLNNMCGVDECNTQVEVDGKTYTKPCCELGESFPHKECKTVTEKNVTYYTCKDIPTCGKNTCDTTKNKEEYNSILKKKIIQNEQCIITTTTSTSSTTTSSTKPAESTSDRYFCDPKTKALGYNQCNTEDSHKYPDAKSCDPKNNKITLIKNEKCDTKNTTCLVPFTYNTDCKISIPPVSKGTTPKRDYCHINILWLRNDETNKTYKKYYITPLPEDGILKTPWLEYTAEYCSKCKLTITPDNEQFVLDNQFGELTGKEIKGYPNKYLFDRSVYMLDKDPLMLNVKSLTPNTVYTITLTCSDSEYTSTESISITTGMGIRWREVVPVIPGNRGR